MEQLQVSERFLKRNCLLDLKLLYSVTIDSCLLMHLYERSTKFKGSCSYTCLVWIVTINIKGLHSLYDIVLDSGM